jgi:hypothetical protein
MSHLAVLPNQRDLRSKQEGYDEGGPSIRSAIAVAA